MERREGEERGEERQEEKNYLRLNKVLMETSEAPLAMTLLHVFRNSATKAQIPFRVEGNWRKGRESRQGGGEDDVVIWVELKKM